MLKVTKHFADFYNMVFAIFSQSFEDRGNYFEPYRMAYNKASLIKFKQKLNKHMIEMSSFTCHRKNRFIF